MFNFCEACAAICCESNLWKLRTQYTESIFCPSEKKTKTKELFYDNDFRKVFVYNSTPDALHDLDTSERKRPRNRTYDGCLWKPAKLNKVRTSKQLRFVANTETFNGNLALRKLGILTSCFEGLFLLFVCFLVQPIKSFVNIVNFVNIM